MADNNIVVAILGKYLPQALIFTSIIFFYEFYIYGILHFPYEGSLWDVLLLIVLQVFSSIGFGVFIFGLMPSLRMSMSICSLWAVLSFSLAGSAFPMMGMDASLQAMTNGYPLVDAWFHLVALLAFTLTPWFVLSKVKNAMLNYVYIP